MGKRHPVISIVGIPNTGKSTLFNRIIGKPKAIIHSSAGMTRDINQGYFSLGERTFLLQDTGGYFDDDQVINREIRRKVMQAVGESDLVIFLFDGRHELLGYEKDLYLEVRRTGVPVITAVNKIDLEEKHIIPASYYRLKTELIAVSAEHRRGIEQLLTQVHKTLGDSRRDSPPPVSAARIGFVGKPNVGKSSLINLLLRDDRIIVTPVPGTTRDSVDHTLNWQQHRLTLVDNAGIRKLQKVAESTEKAAVIRTRNLISRLDIIIFVVDVSLKITREDLYISRLVEKSAKPVIIAANKWDLVREPATAARFLQYIGDRFHRLDYAPVLLTSALSRKGLYQILEQILGIITSLQKPVKTAEVNRMIRDLIQERKLYTTNGRIFDPKYTVIESRQPYFFRFHLGSDTRLKAHSEKYLKKRIREVMNLRGIPVFFKSVHS